MIKPIFLMTRQAFRFFSRSLGFQVAVALLHTQPMPSSLTTVNLHSDGYNAISRADGF